jgi:hypothetical protein
MCDTYSTRQALMLGVLFPFWAIHIVQCDAEQLRILPKVEKDEQINEEGTTLTLTCIVQNFRRTLDDSIDQKWTLPRSEVIQITSINYF